MVFLILRNEWKQLYLKILRINQNQVENLKINTIPISSSAMKKVILDYIYLNKTTFFIELCLDTCNFNEDSQETCFRAFKSDGKDSKLNDAVQMSMSFQVCYKL